MAKTSAVRHARDVVGGQWGGEVSRGLLVGAFSWEEVDGNTGCGGGDEDGAADHGECRYDG